MQPVQVARTPAILRACRTRSPVSDLKDRAPKKGPPPQPLSPMRLRAAYHGLLLALATGVPGVSAHTQLRMCTTGQCAGTIVAADGQLIAPPVHCTLRKGDAAWHLSARLGIMVCLVRFFNKKIKSKSKSN